MNKRTEGSKWEAVAGDFLTRHGIDITEYNFRCRYGEIDIIGNDKGTIVFYEVKYRKDSAYGSPAEAVGIKKQKVIAKVSDYYRMLNNIPWDTPIRYDVVAIQGNRIELIPAAFMRMGF